MNHWFRDESCMRCMYFTSIIMEKNWSTAQTRFGTYYVVDPDRRDVLTLLGNSRFLNRVLQNHDLYELNSVTQCGYAGGQYVDHHIANLQSLPRQPVLGQFWLAVRFYPLTILGFTLACSTYGVDSVIPGTPQLRSIRTKWRLSENLPFTNWVKNWTT